jgi:hypothetical protein
LNYKGPKRNAGGTRKSANSTEPSTTCKRHQIGSKPSNDGCGVITDHYKKAAARDREPRVKAEDDSRTLTITMQNIQGQINRLHGEQGIFQGRAE